MNRRRVDNSTPASLFRSRNSDSKYEKCCRRHSRYDRINILVVLGNVRSTYDKIIIFYSFLSFICRFGGLTLVDL